ncbi:MAG: hypothetical protein J2P27_06190 [Actinobacteria bacterium]|nr:hypothetical protein [Actinomycetota bacterium]
MTGTTIVALISVIASAVVALTGTIVPQVLGGRERRVAHFLAHEIWWRDTRSPIYSEILSFCIRVEQENEPNLDEPSITELRGRVGAMGSPKVSEHFDSFISALRNGNAENASLEYQTLRELISGELWNLSQGFH